jgi:hypothetical protein
MDIIFDPSLTPKSSECLEKLFDLIVTLMMCSEAVNSSVSFDVSDNAVIRVAMQKYRCKLQDDDIIDYFRKLE